MSELRYNPLSGEWVIIATKRVARPESFSQKEVEPVKSKNKNPFLYGNESMTPPEVYAVGPEGRQPNTPDWQIRVVPNKYPALTREVLPQGQIVPSQSGAISMAYGYGVHEVVISSPAADKSIAQLDQAQVEHIVETWQKRYRVMARDKLVNYIQIICNHGKPAGASLEHPHSQIFGLPIVPQVIRHEMTQTADYRKRNKSGLHGEILKSVQEHDLEVFENEHFTVFAPFWSAMPFECWIMPRKAQPYFELISDKERAALAKSLRMLLQKYFLKLNNPSYNFFVHTAPIRHEEAKAGQDDHYFWHIECFPRLNVQAGLEYGAGVFINTALPEDVANFLRT